MQWDDFIKRTMGKGKRDVVPARLQSALALLEKLRDDPDLTLSKHLASEGSTGLKGHETWGDRAHERLGIGEALNKNHGRRSSSLRDWGQELLDVLKSQGFENAGDSDKSVLIDTAQAAFASRLRQILEEDPIHVGMRRRSAEAVIRDVLDQADDKGRAGDVAQYLVGAKLMMRLDKELPVYPANKSDRSSRTDLSARLGDFEVADAIVEVAIGPPDQKHIGQIAQVQEETDKEIWLLTRGHRVGAWQTEINNTSDVDLRRVIVDSVEGFVGQNITELGGFSSKGRSEKLLALFDLYNTRWISAVGSPGIRIEAAV